MYIIILDLTPGFIGLGKDNCKTRRETLKLGDLVWLIVDILRYMYIEMDCCFFSASLVPMRSHHQPLWILRSTIASMLG